MHQQPEFVHPMCACRGSGSGDDGSRCPGGVAAAANDESAEKMEQGS